MLSFLLVGPALVLVLYGGPQIIWGKQACMKTLNGQIVSEEDAPMESQVTCSCSESSGDSQFHFEIKYATWALARLPRALKRESIVIACICGLFSPLK